MPATARRCWVVSLVLLAFVFPFPHAEALIAPGSAAPPGPFLVQARADRQGGSVLPALTATPSVALAISGTRLSSEAVRAQLWLPASPPPARTTVVREGQSLWTIAGEWGISVETIARANNLANADVLKPGQQLLIPAASGPRPPVEVAANLRVNRAKKSRPVAGRPLLVTVREGQSLWTIAAANGVSVGVLAEANDLRDADMIRAGQRLVIPGRSAVALRRTTVRVGGPASGGAFVRAASATAVRIAQGFLWPARGRLTSRFGWRRWRHHDGLDIAAPRGSPIYAARPGRVVFSGWYYAYGRAVILDHGNGLQTLYGHASALLVDVGEYVQQGQLIAKVGSSGRSTGPHVHFEVRVNGKAVNPISYME